MGLQHFRHVVSSRKADNTIVTEADQAIERFLVERLSERYPHHGILGEEGAYYRRSASQQWVLDPIDGTSVFAVGLPVWAICIGFMQDDVPRAGVVYLPVTGDCFAVDLQGPALLNGEPISPAPHAPYNRDSIIFGAADAHRLWRIDFPGKVRGFGSCAAHLCYVAAGMGVGAVNTRTSLWDVAAALPILTRAGAQVTLLDGSPLPLDRARDGAKFPQPILAAPPHYLDDLRARLHYLGA